MILLCNFVVKMENKFCKCARKNGVCFYRNLDIDYLYDAVYFKERVNIVKYIRSREFGSKYYIKKGYEGVQRGLVTCGEDTMRIFF